MSKESIKQAADALFASTAHNVLWANQKGEFFTSENIGSLSLKAGEKLSKFERTAESAVTEERPVKPLNAIETIAKIMKVTSLKELAAFETDERKVVKIAYEGKLDQLTAAINVVGATTEIGTEGTTEGTTEGATEGTSETNGNEDTDTKK